MAQVSNIDRRVIARPAPPMGHRAARGAVWYGIQTLWGKFLSLASQIILAALLLPDDFGKIALATIVVTFANIIAQPGIEDVLVQRQRHFSRWATAAFWMSLMFGILGACLMAASAPLAAFVYGTPELLWLILIPALAAPLNALCVVPIATLRARLRYRDLALISTGEFSALQIGIIMFAATGFGAYSFVLPILIVAALKACMLWLLVKPRLRKGLALRRWRMISGDSAASLGNRLLINAVAQGDYFVLGLMTSTTVVGNYFLGFSLSTQSLRMLAGSLQGVMFPSLSRLLEEPARQLEAAIRAASLLAVLCTPLCLVQALVAGPAMHIFFGSKWDSAIPVVQLLSIGMSIESPSWIIAALLQARGEFRRSLLLSACFAPFFFLSVIVGAKYGSALGVAAGVSIFYFVNGPIYTYLGLKSSGASTNVLLPLYGKPLLIGGLIALLGFLVTRFIPDGPAANWERLLLPLGIAAALFYPLCRWIAPELWKDLVGRIHSTLRPPPPIVGASALR